jgi:hypothetical protein
MIYLDSDDSPDLLERARELLRHFRTLTAGLEGIRLFPCLGAKAADILVRRGRHQGAARSKEQRLAASQWV